MTSYQESDAASRQDSAKGARGCLIPLIAATIVLAIAVTLFSWFAVDGDDAGTPAAPPARHSTTGDTGD